MPKYGDYALINQVQPTDYFVVVDSNDSMTKQVSIVSINKIVGNIIQSVTGTRTVTTSGDFEETVNTDKYNRSIDSATGNTTVTIAGTVTETYSGTYILDIGSSNYYKEISAGEGSSTETLVGGKNVSVGGTYFEYVDGSRIVVVKSTAPGEQLYSQSIHAGFNTVTESIGGAYTQTFTDNVNINVNAGKYTKTITAASGNTSEYAEGSFTQNSLGDRIIKVNTSLSFDGLYNHTVNGATGNTTETIEGTFTQTIVGATAKNYQNNYTETITGERFINVNGGGYIHFVDGFNNVTEDIAGTRTLTVSGVNVENYQDACSTNHENDFNRILLLLGVPQIVETYSVLGDYDYLGTGYYTLNVTGTLTLQAGIINAGTSLPQYASNALAIVGGLNIGDLYYTQTAGEGFVKVVIP